jgi:hypothetical protein
MLCNSGYNTHKTENHHEPNKKKAIALAAAVTSLSASLGVATGASKNEAAGGTGTAQSSWETHEIKGGSANSMKQSDHIKLNNSTNSTQSKLSTQSKTSTHIKISNQQKQSNAIKLESKEK